MHEYEEPGTQAYLSRSEVELELARIALVVMRASPQTYAEVGLGRHDAGSGDLGTLCSGLLMRTAPEHRPFVEHRLLELARSLASGRADAGHDWLQLTIDLPPPGAGAPLDAHR